MDVVGLIKGYASFANSPYNSFDMANRTINVQFEIELDEYATERVVQALGCKPSKLSETLSIYGKAALLEYIEMFRGNASLRLAVDTREQRLLQIILSVYEGELPGEAVVARLFHLTRSQARSLLRTVLEKKAFELREHISKACVSVLEPIDVNSSNPIEVMINNPRVFEVLNQILTDNGKAPLLEKVTVTKYTLDKAALTVLRKHFDLDGGVDNG